MDVALKAAAEPLTLACALAVEEDAARSAGATAARVGLRAGLPAARGAARVASALPARSCRARARHAASPHAGSSTRTAPSSGRTSPFASRAPSPQSSATPGASSTTRSSARELARRTGAAAADTESATLAATGRLAGVIRAISDTPEQPVGRLAQRRRQTVPPTGAWSRGPSRPSLGRASERRSPPAARWPLCARGSALAPGAAREKRVLVASPRSFCAGVVRAIDIVEKLLETPRPAGLRPPRDRPQRPRRARSRVARRGLRRSPRKTSPRARSSSSRRTASRRGLREVRRARPPGRRRRLPAGLQGPRRGAPLRRRAGTRSRSSATPAMSRSRGRWGRRPTRSSSSRRPRTSRRSSSRRGRASRT